MRTYAGKYLSIDYQIFKAVIYVFVLLSIVIGLSLAPATSHPAQASGWCTKKASFAGQRGWDRWYNPNFMVDFNIDAGRHSYYIYYNNSYVGPNVIGLRNYNPSKTTTEFGVDTTWALRHWGWNNKDKWRIDYNC